MSWQCKICPKDIPLLLFLFVVLFILVIHNIPVLIVGNLLNNVVIGVSKVYHDLF
jgi:hypothetical protein